MSNLLHVDVEIEVDDGAYYGSFAVPSVKLVGDWEYEPYPAPKPVIVNGRPYGKDVPVPMVKVANVRQGGVNVRYHEDDPMMGEICAAIIDKVQVALGRMEVAAELAYEAQQEREAEDEASRGVIADECVEMKVRDRIEEKYGN